MVAVPAAVPNLAVDERLMPLPAVLQITDDVWGLDWPRFARGGILVGTNGGETVSTEAVASRRHAGRHLPVIGWNITTANTQLALAA
jgi:hypothetical protein